MGSSTTSWTVTPSDLLAGIEAYAERVEQAVEAIANLIAARMEGHAKQFAPWNDQTGNARDGLTSQVEVAGDLVTIYLSHGEDIDYGLALELGHGGKYAVIWPTIEQLLPEIEQLLADMFQ